MKQYKYLYRKMLDKNLILQAYLNLRSNKTKRVEIQYIDSHLQEEIDKMYEMIANTRPGKVPNPELAFKPIKHKPKYIRENGKCRTIYIPEIHEQWLHHIIVLVLKPIILSTAKPNTCGSFPNRGPHYGKRKIMKWIRKGEYIRYYMKIDIRHFFDNIQHKVLFRELSNRIKDDWFLYVIRLCLSGFKKGLPLGFYISQWLANYILEPVDYLIGSLSSKSIRYMDDIISFGDDADCLKILVNKVSSMLGHRLHLNLKGNYQVTLFDRYGRGRPLDFMGFLFYKNKVIMRKRIMLKATKLARKIYSKRIKGYRIYKKWISGLLSYMGWFEHTDTYGCYLKYIKPYVKIGALKRIISSLDRKENYDRLERNTIFTGTEFDHFNCSRPIFASQKCAVCV